MEQVVVLLLLAFVPAIIAKRKGRSFSLWYVYGLLLWLVAIIHSLCMKDKSGMQCPACKEWIAENATVCKYCHTVIADFYRDNKDLSQNTVNVSNAE